MKRRISKHTKKLAEETKSKIKDEYKKIFDIELQKAVNSGKTGKDAIKRASYYTIKKEFEDNKISADRRTKAFKKYYERYKEKMIEETKNYTKESKEAIEKKSSNFLKNKIESVLKEEEKSIEEKIHKLIKYTAKKEEYNRIRASEELKYKFGINVEPDDLEFDHDKIWIIKSTGRVIDLGVKSPDDDADSDAMLDSLTIEWRV